MKNNTAILLVEDDCIDVMTVKRAFKELNIPNPLETTGNGEEALAFLKDDQNERPGIILLDLNMPGMNGVEFLKIIRQDQALKVLPVVVLTTSKAEQDVTESFNSGVSGYMVKPVGYSEFVEVIKKIHTYWAESELVGTN